MRSPHTTSTPRGKPAASGLRESARTEQSVASNWDTTLKSAHDIFREEFATMRDLCAQSNIPFAVVIMPTAQAVDKPDGDAAIPIRKAREIFDSLGIAYVDITPALAKAGLNQTFFTWDTHLNPTGNKVAADAILVGWTSR